MSKDHVPVVTSTQERDASAMRNLIGLINATASGRYAPMEASIEVLPEGAAVRMRIDARWTPNGQAWGAFRLFLWDELRSSQLNFWDGEIREVHREFRNLMVLGSWPGDPNYASKRAAKRAALGENGSEA